MQKLTGLTEDSKQNLLFYLENDEVSEIDLEFRDNVRGWFYGIKYNNFVIKNRKLVNSPNIIRQYKNILPFGISAISNDKLDPLFLSDFVNERIQIFILEKNEVLEIETEFFE